MFTNDFKTNVAILEEKLGHPVNETTWAVAQLSLSSSDDLMFLAAREGKFVSCALMEFLSGGRDQVYVDGDQMQSAIQSFFAEKWDEEGHPVIDFFHNEDVTITRLYQRTGKEEELVNFYWGIKDTFSTSDEKDPALVTLQDVIGMLDYGVIRTAEPSADTENGWKTNEWVKKAILLFLKLSDGFLMDGGTTMTTWYDKVPSKFCGWHEDVFKAAGIRTVMPAFARQGAFIGQRVILMPSFVNIGAYVDDGTMVDTWATVGSCAQIGKNVHLSGGVGIGGVLEPPQATPTIIEDGAFIGARSEVVEWVIVRRRAVLSMGVFVGKNTPIVDRTRDGVVIYGEVPENAVVRMGVHPEKGLICPHITHYRDENTDAATALNDMLR